MWSSVTGSPSTGRMVSDGMFSALAERIVKRDVSSIDTLLRKIDGET